ncbi:Uncharacterised protein [Neisseria meningitidis]|nr:Uncharacterised protein [Neisseria meningitidis]
MFGLGCLKMCRLLWLASVECGSVAVHRRVGFSPPPHLPLFYCCCSLLLFRWAEAHPTLSATSTPPMPSESSQSGFSLCFEHPPPYFPVSTRCGGMRGGCVRRRVGFSPPPRLPLFYCCCSLPLFRWAEAHPTLSATSTPPMPSESSQSGFSLCFEHLSPYFPVSARFGGMRGGCVRRRVGFSPPPRLPLFYCCCSLPLFRWAEAHPTERQAAVRGNIRIVSGAGLFRAAGLR